MASDPPIQSARASAEGPSAGIVLDDLAIQRALTRTSGQVSEAAKGLGLSRSALYRRLQHHGLKGNE